MDIAIYLLAILGAMLLWLKFRGRPTSKRSRFSDKQGNRLEITLSEPWGETESLAPGSYLLKNHRDGTLLYLMPHETLGTAKQAFETMVMLERTTGIRVPDTVKARTLAVKYGEGYYYQVAWDEGMRTAGVVATGLNTVTFNIIDRSVARAGTAQALHALGLLRRVS